MLRTERKAKTGLFHQQHPSADPVPDAGRLASAVELVPADYFAPLDLATVFSRPAPLEIDLGCGDGSFLVAMADQFPERNFLGIERLFGRVSSACGRAARKRLSNVRVLRVETSYAVQYLIPPGSTAMAHLLFPDPWPKKRHHRRRIVTPDFLAAVHRLLALDGSFRIATDQADYFAAIRELIAPSAWAEVPGESEGTLPCTKFEKRFLAQGTPIYRLVLRKTL